MARTSEALDAFLYFKKNKAGDTVAIEGETTDLALVPSSKGSAGSGKDDGASAGIDRKEAIAGSPIELQSYQLGLSIEALWPYQLKKAKAAAGKSGNANWLPKPKLNNFTFSKAVDSGTPGLFQALCTNATYDEVCLIQRRAGGTIAAAGHVFLKITFGQVVVTNMDWTTGGAEAPPLETVQLSYRSMKIEYWPQKHTGGRENAAKSAEFALPDGSSDGGEDGV
ncbi:MAG TPA: type VI secretion system tube protein Hcp [Stellaceae bacterium]|nr:type VI secretion system tube protein Hcp [Stellaceae bacterium]